MRPACRSFRRALLLDDGLAELEQHLTGCGRCQRFRDRELATRNLLREHRPRWSASPELRRRVAGAMAAAHRETPPSPAARRARTLTAALAAAALVAIAVLAVAHLSRGEASSPGQREAHLTTEYVIEDHLAYARDRYLHTELTAPSPDQVRSYFESELSLAVRLPELEGATLTGARRCQVRGRPAALVFYERAAPGGSTEPVSLFVFERQQEDFSAMEEVEGMAGKRSCRHSARGISVVSWEERGLIYTLAGALESDELGSLLAPQ